MNPSFLLSLPFKNKEDPFRLIHPEISTLNTYTNILLIDNSVESYQTFVDSANTNTFPIIYSIYSLKTDLLTLLKTNFTSISRIGIVFVSSLESPKIFLDLKPLFLGDEEEPFSENMQFIIDIIKKFQVTNIDYLACNTLNYPNYLTYYDTVKRATGIIVGASNDKTGNIKYGGDWIMESTSQDVEFIYFTQSIEYYSYLLDSSILGRTGNGPEGITIDSLGNIYTANNVSNNVTKITPAGVSSILGRTENGPAGITIDSLGNIYTANYSSNNVTKITPAGASSILGRTGNGPEGITIDSLGNIYTANNVSNNVTKITPAGVSSILGTTELNPFGITIDTAGNIYTANSSSNNVTKITPAGASTIFGTTGSNPFGITIDSLGNIYTANINSNNVTKITPAGASSILGRTGDGPIGITIDSLGNIYTANFFNSNVTKITPAGTPTILGTTGQGPFGITIDSSGNIYTANLFDNNVTKITNPTPPAPNIGYELVAYIITYNNNGGTGSVSSQSAICNTSLTLSGASTIAKAGYSFISWNTSSDGSGTSYQPLSIYTVTNNITLYAIYIVNNLYSNL